MSQAKKRIRCNLYFIDNYIIKYNYLYCFDVSQYFTDHSNLIRMVFLMLYQPFFAEKEDEQSLFKQNYYRSATQGWQEGEGKELLISDHPAV